MAVEDSVTLGCKPDQTEILCRIDELSTKELPEYPTYRTPPAKYSDMAKVTTTTIRQTSIIEYPYVGEMMRWQAEQLDYAVCALAIWMTTKVGQYVCSQLPIWKIPLDEWPGIVRDFGNACRRMGQIFGTGPDEVELAFQMRKLVCLCGRSDAEADWDKEVRERTTLGTAKRACAGGVVSTAAFRKLRQYELDRIVTSCMPELIKRAGDLDEYLDMRWWATPRGTSSHGGDVKRQLKALDNSMLDLQLRPIKPTVQEQLKRGDLLNWLRTKPQAQARGSTKPEPGMKCRALLAVDDTTALIAGYASQHVETVTKYGGMVLRQDPSDVSEWVNFDTGPDVWRVSNDYTNFNILNSLRSMQLIDLTFADHWSRVPYTFAEQKRLACLWVAASYNDMLMVTPAGEHRVLNGLWSGHRNTARDNTMLHVVYLEAVKDTLRALFGSIARVTKQRVCGDDETVAYSSWAPAVTHTLVANALGYASQVDKGLLSRRHDEFLQLMRTPGAPPKYPVCHTILTFCSGNWYKDPVRDLGSTVKDVSDHLWDMVLGGVPEKVARELCIHVCDYLMQVKGPDGQLIPLEWYRYRGCGLPGGHPLWGYEGEPCPKVTVQLDVGDVKAHSTDQSMAREEDVWRNVDAGMRAQVRRDRLNMSYRQVAKNALTEAYDEAARKIWPVRCSTASAERGPIGLEDVPANRWRAIPERAVERSARAVAIKAKFPPELLTTDYMWDTLQYLRPRDRAVLVQGLQQRQKPTRGWRWQMPPLLRVT